MESTYQATLAQLRTETAELLRRRRLIDVRLASLKKAINSLDALAEKEGGETEAVRSATGRETSVGLTDAIRDLLRTAGVPLSPTQIRDRLVERGQFNPNEYANFLTTVHNTLYRLVVSRHIGFMEVAGKTVYLHKSSKKSAADEE